MAEVWCFPPKAGHFRKIATKIRWSSLASCQSALACGFIVFSFANMRSLETFGLVTTLSIVLAFLADIVVSPALLTLVSPRRSR